MEVRKRKEEAKVKAQENREFCAAVFDLQQVIYLPQSTRSELFYKRRLANYNFTVYNLASKEGTCYLSHEGQTRRGACEIASNLHRFLIEEDAKGVKEVEFFCDGCAGQNKNSILPSMMLSFLNKSANVEKICINYFETNHGQSEGDSMHSVIERRLRQQTELFLPAQLASLCRMAKETPPRYNVVAVQATDITDWKTHSQKMGVLRVRSADDGTPVDWTNFKSIRMSKEEVDTIYFKNFHTEEIYHRLPIGGQRRSSRSSGQEEVLEPQSLYEGGPPKIPQAKYEDLMSLCCQQNPVVSHPDYQSFYKQLPH